MNRILKQRNEPLCDLFGIGTILGSMINTVGNSITNENNNAEAAKREAKARAENYKFNEMAADNADARTRALFKDFYSPKAKIEQLKEAGLSPSLYAGGEGIGAGVGSAGAQGAGAAGTPTGQVFGNQPFAFDFSKIAEANLMEAQAKKANAETKEIQGETPEAKARIANIWADTGLKGAQEAGQDIENRLKLVDEQIANANFENNVKLVEANANEAEARAQFQMWQAMNENLQFNFNTQTFETRKKQIEANLNNTLSDTNLKNMQKNLTAEQCRKVREEANIVFKDYLLREQQQINELNKVKNDWERVKEYQRHNKAMENYFRDELRQRYVKMGVDFTETIINTIASVAKIQAMTTLMGGAKTATTTYGTATAPNWTN